MGFTSCWEEVESRTAKGHELREAGTDRTVAAVGLPQSPWGWSWDQPVAQIGGKNPAQERGCPGLKARGLFHAPHFLPRHAASTLEGRASLFPA